MNIKLPDFNLLQQKIINHIFEGVTRRTPVDTGTARDNWEKTDNSVSNATPYIGILEMGSSDQAPQGFVRITLEEIPIVIDSFIKETTQ